MEQNELDIKYIKEKLQLVLNNAHNISTKKTINDGDKDLIFACPICGDSHKKNHLKRAHLYKDNLMMKCFNEGCYLSFTELCSKFNVDIDIDTKLKLYSYIDSNTKFKNNNSDYILTEMDKLIPIDDFIEYFNNKKNSYLYDIKPIQYNSDVYNYLRTERLIQDFSQIYQGIYRVIKDNKIVYYTRVLINMNMLLSDKKLLGIQLRNLESDKNKRFFKIIEFEELYNYMYPDKKIDEIHAIPYNKLSHYFNILNINFDNPITIFEGFLDSTFYLNSIGLIGSNATNDILNFLMESDENLKLQFFYDNDITGVKKATEMLKKGYPVFLWNKLIDKIVEHKKDKYEAITHFKGIIDLNDLVIKSNNPNIYDKLKLDKFFSKDEFDLIYLDKLIFDKNSKTWSKK